MQPIRFDSTSYLIGGKRVYLYSGEFHYFRVPQRDWRRRMRLFKAAGGNTLATYIPWALHEPREGRFTFSGKPWLDLELFLDMAADEGLYVIARPGPYIYSETVYDGLPLWLCDNYPALRARNRAGKDFRRSSVSYLHPVFLEKSRRWFDQVCPRLAPRMVDKGGSVAMVQLDNELTGIHVWFGTLDYNRESMGFGRKNGRFPLWLQARYETMAALNRHYGSSFKSWAAVEPPPVPAATAAMGDLRRAKDYVDFYFSTIADYGTTLAGWVREHGVDCPLVHNSGSPPMNAYYREMNAALKPGGFLLGSDHYYTLNQDWGQNNPTPQYAVRSFISLETLRLMDAPPTVFELPGGSGSDWPPIGREDAEACYFTNLALGMKGHNFYVFTGGPNPPGLGNTDTIYDYGASIAADGTRRPLFDAQKAMGTFLKKNDAFPSSVRESDFRVLVDWTASRADQWNRQRGPFALAPQESWEFMRKGLLTSAFCAGLSPELVDGESTAWALDTGTPLAVPSSSVMTASVQARLVQFLKRGGKMMIGPVWPEWDETLKPCTTLRDYVGATAKTETIPDGSFVRLPFAGTIYCTSLAVTMARLPKGAVVLGRDTLNKGAAAWMKKIPGGGRVLWLGLQWVHAMRYQERLLKGSLAKLGLRSVIGCSNPNLWCTLWTHEKRSVLFVMNLHVAPQEANLTCQPSWSRKPLAVGNIRVPPMKVRTIVLS